VPFLTYSPGAQGAFYIAGLTGHLGLVAAVAYATQAVRSGYPGVDRHTAKSVRLLASGAAVALVATLLLGRDLVLYTALWQQVNLAALGVAVALAAAAVWVVRGVDSRREAADAVGAD